MFFFSRSYPISSFILFARYACPQSNCYRPLDSLLSCLLSSSSFPRDRLILGHSDVLADAAERSWRIVEFLRRVDALAQRKRIRVVKELHLGLASHAIVNSTYTWVLLVQPAALHIGLLLRVVLLRVYLTDQVGDLLDALLLARADVSTGKRALGLLVLSSGLSWGLWATLSKVVPILCAEVTSVMSGLMSGNDSAEALGCGLDGSIDEGELRDVVLVDHAEDGLLLAHVYGWPLDVLLVRRLQLAEAIVTDQVLGLLLRLAIDGAERRGQTT